STPDSSRSRPRPSDRFPRSARESASREPLLSPCALELFVVEKHVARWHAALAAEGEIQVAVAARNVVGRFESQSPGGPLDPARDAFDLQVIGDRRFVHRHLACIAWLGVLGAVFLVAKYGPVAQVRENLFQLRAVVQIDFDLLTFLVAARLGRTFIS